MILDDNTPKRHFREILLLFFVVLSLLFVSLYTSFAIFNKTVEKVGVANIVASNLVVTLSTTDSVAQTTTKTISIAAGETKFIDVKVTNSSAAAVRYKLYYKNSSSSTLPSSVQVGVSNISVNPESSTLTKTGTTGNNKTVRIAIKNESTSSYSIIIGVESGYSSNSLSLTSGNLALSATISEIVLVKAFDYKGSYETWTVPENGVYQIESWGASGNGASGYGLGAYTNGNIYLTKNTVLYIYVGGQGTKGSAGAGGFNGGGAAGTGSSGTNAGGGGGATDIRYGTATSSRIMVAAGGGGRGGDYAGGAGGALTGINATGSTNAPAGQGGTQTAGGTAGTNGTAGSLATGGKGSDAKGGNYPAGGGGGGYYGGGGGGSVSNYGAGGGGGSSYVSGCNSNSNYSSCAAAVSNYSFISSSIEMIAGNESMPSARGTGNTTGNNGHGYVKISKNPIYEAKEYDYTGAYQTFVASRTGNYQLEVWGAEGGYRTSTNYGGKGGYAKGTVSLNAGDKLYIYVGGQGNSTAKGWNGGGTAGYSGIYGGGATDIRYGEYTNPLNSTSLNQRIIVAGGGGSVGAAAKKGGGGGGTTGGTTTESYTGQGCSSSICGQGGTQSSGGAGTATSGYTATAGSFGKGGTGYSVSSGYGGAGGGGWYGGSGSVPDGSGDDDRGGGGGSGYVLTSSSTKPSGYSPSSKYYLTNTSLVTGVSGNTSITTGSIPNPRGSGTVNGVVGNGYARIIPM